MNKKVTIFVISFLCLATAAQAQFPTCNPLLVEWFPHPHDCESFIICFHGVMHILSCAPGLHFNAEEERCMFPADARCHIDYLCPEVDDDDNPFFLPDPEDCGVYYLCSRGTPIRRECAPGLWWDVVFEWCNTWDDVVCDNRTIINPDNPGNRTTLAPETTTTAPLTTTPAPTPDFNACHMRQDLFDGNTYLKSMCIVNLNSNYEALRQRCVQLNMNLFIIDDSQVQTPFFEATTTLLQAHQGGFVWINGRRNSQSQWEVFNADNTLRGPLYSGIDWVNTSSVHGPTNGDCLRYSSQFGPYQAMGIACTANSWGTCEYFLQTQDPPTTTTPTTTTTSTLATTTEDPTGPNLSVCWRTADFIVNGEYIKSSCIINTSRNYAAAEQFCRTNRMELFIIDGPQLQIQFRNSTRQLLVNQPRGFVWINGRIDDECRNWYVFNPERSELWSGVHWVQHDEWVGRSTGPCLRYSQQYTADYYAMGTACENQSWQICEFFLPPVKDAYV